MKITMNENRPVSSVFIIHLCKLLNTSSGSNRSPKVDTVGFRAVGAAFMSQLSSSDINAALDAQ